MVLDRLDWELRESAAVRLTCLRWRNIHDGGCNTLRLCYRVTGEMVGALCARLPALTEMELTSRSLTDEGLGVVAGLTSLTRLSLGYSNVTDVGLQELTNLTALNQLYVFGCSTSKAGRDALKAAIPGLTIYPDDE